MAEAKRTTHFRGKDRRGRRVPLGYRDLSHGELGPELRAVTRNIGVGGAFIETDDPMVPGTHLKVPLTLETGDVIAVDAEVRWILDGDDDDVHGMGVKFLGLGPEQLHTLNDYLTSLPQSADLDDLL